MFGNPSRSTISIDLYRDGTDSPWGFRLKGGTDIDGGTPLEITKVFVGSASEGILYPGDRVVAINHQDTSKLTHIDAQNIMKNAGTTARIDVIRPGLQKPRGSYGNTASGSFFHQDSHGTEVSKVHTQPFRTQQLVFPSAKSHNYPALGRVEKANPDMPAPPIHHYLPQNPKSAIYMKENEYQAMIEKQHGKNAVRTVIEAVRTQQQPFRTTPLVTPSPRSITEVGQTIGHRREAAGAKPATAATKPPPLDSSPKGSSATMVRSINVGGAQKQIVSHQFNSPMGIYSDEALMEAAATGNPQAAAQRIGHHPGYVQSSKPHLPTPKDATFSRPHESETFKIILEAEMDKAKDQKGVVGSEFSKHHHYSLDRSSSGMSNKSHHVDPVLLDNSINQSASFKRVMHSVTGDTDL